MQVRFSLWDILSDPTDGIDQTHIGQKLQQLFGGGGIAVNFVHTHPPPAS